MQIIVCGLDHMHSMLGRSTLLLVELRFGQGHQGRVQRHSMTVVWCITANLGMERPSWVKT
jgi:hypothetical protein